MQENEQLKKDKFKLDTKCCIEESDHQNTLEKLVKAEDENEQLKGQNAAMKAAVELALKSKCGEESEMAFNTCVEAIAEVQEYHNPADVAADKYIERLEAELAKDKEALRMAREAIKQFVDEALILTGDNENLIIEGSSYWKFKAALKAIDGGGKGE
jgi:hypothetical protein